MILVTGATGNVGGELVRALAGAGQPVRALIRAGREQDFPPGVQPVTGDLNQPESMRPRPGRDARHCSSTRATRTWPARWREARQAGVRRVVCCPAVPRPAAT